jgi:hypothetical protein
MEPSLGERIYDRFFLELDQSGVGWELLTGLRRLYEEGRLQREDELIELFEGLAGDEV